MHLEVEPLDLGSVVREALAALDPALSQSGSGLTVTVDGPVPGRWDAGRLAQLVRNLVGNAIKYGLGKPIEVVVRAEGPDAVLVVRDHGMGIAADRLAHVFDPFERAVSHRHYGGLGLGLYICRSIVEALGGRLDVQSEEGIGSTFVARLPREPEGSS